jgi:hypothetical protein
MVNSILDAVTTQLHSTFGDNYKYYVENVQQGMERPCFTVDVLQPFDRSRMIVLHDRTMPLVVHYFSDKPTTNKKDSYAIAERIVECLEILPFKDTLLRGDDISWHMVDDVLQLFITYKFQTQKIVPKDNMEILEGTRVSSH